MSDSLSAAWAARKAARGASRSCNPETEFTAGHASRDAEVATLRAEKDSPHADAKYWRELQEAQTEVRRLGRLVNMSTGKLLPALAERDAALAVIEAVRAVMDRPSDPNGFYLNGFPNQYDALAEGYGDELPNALRSALAKSPTDALAEHDRAVVKSALHGFADRLSGDYALDQSSPAALLGHIVGLARRDGGAV